MADKTSQDNNQVPETNHQVGVFVNSSGQSFKVRGISPMLPERLERLRDKEWRELGKEIPTPPTYTIELAGGDTEVVPHDEKSIADPKTPDEEKAAWAQYEKDVMQYNKLYNDKLMNVAFLSVLIDPDKDDPGWESDFEFLGFDVPKSRSERKSFM